MNLQYIKLTVSCDNYIDSCSYSNFALYLRRDCCHHFVSERDFGRDAQRVCQSRKVSDESLGRDETSFVRLATNDVIITRNCQLYCQFLLVNLCGRESLCDIRRDCCHHFVSERDSGRDAQRVCKAERFLMSPLARMDETSFVRLATNNVIITRYEFMFEKYK